MYSKVIGVLSISLIFLLGCSPTPAPTNSNVVHTTTNLTPMASPVLLSINLNQPRLYTHPSRRFQINYPADWQQIERADGTIFAEPSGQAGYSLFFSDVGRAYTIQEIERYSNRFIVDNFAVGNPSVVQQEQIGDHAMRLRFTSDDPNLGRMMSELQVQQHESIIFMLLINTTQHNWERFKEALHQLTGTFQPLDLTPAEQPTPTSVPPTWRLIGPQSNSFGFAYPNDWVVLQREEQLVSVGMAERDLIFTVSSYPWPHPNSTDIANRATEAYLQQLTAEYGSVEQRPIIPFPLDRLSGVTVDFLYQDERGNDIAGSVITAAQKGVVYQIVFTAPALAFENALYWFNPMYKSVRILAPEYYIVTE